MAVTKTAERDPKKSIKRSLIARPNSNFHPSMPEAICREILSWEVVSKSPYSYSYYDITNKSWDDDGIEHLRVSDHWNFESRGRIHCVTDVPVTNGDWVLARHGLDGIYHVLMVVPRLAEDSEEYRQHWAEIKADERKRREEARAHFYRLHELATAALGVDIPQQPANPNAEWLSLTSRKAILLSYLFPGHFGSGTVSAEVAKLLKLKVATLEAAWQTVKAELYGG